MIPTQRQIDLMDPKDRAQFPKQIRLTSSERKAANENKGEIAIHNEFIKYLKLRSKVFQYDHSATNKPATNQKGQPDFAIHCRIIVNGKPKTSTCFIEMKVPGGRLSQSQIQRFSDFSEAGIDVFVCTSAGDAINQILEYFELPTEALNK